MEQVSLIISDRLRLRKDVMAKNNEPLLPGTPPPEPGPEVLYRRLQYSYPKFFKMDTLCKWAWLGAEALLCSAESSLYEGIDKNKIAVVLLTSHGCLDVDKKYSETLVTIPSPALFVYTLPNIMLGEICIRHGFKGEQACMVNDAFDSNELYFWVSDLVQKRGMDACLCGWVDTNAGEHDVCLFWVVKGNNGMNFSTETIQKLYNA